MHEKFGAGGDDNLLINFTWPYVLYMCIILCETCYLHKCVSLGAYTVYIASRIVWI